MIRWGGDEFLIVGRCHGLNGPNQLAERIRCGLMEHTFLVGNGSKGYMTGSIGFAPFPFNSWHPERFNWEQVLAIADQAAYVAKSNGRNAWLGIEGAEMFGCAEYNQIGDSLQKLFDQGDIYKAEYTGYYSRRAEQFLQEKDKNEDGTWPEIFGEVEEIAESNYFFKLSRHQDWLIDHIKTNEEFIFPRFRAKQVLEFLKEPINDLCISRPKERLEWGIPLPFDDGYVTYVWFDALFNYVTAAGYGTDDFEKRWPADFHVIGKDILVPPHAVYWPIMLKAAEIELPKSLLVHGWWLKSGEKMSKSTGTVVDPLDLIEQFGSDAFRYFVTREMNVGQDSEFSLDRYMVRYNSDLANDLGNLLSRVLTMLARGFEGVIPAPQLEETLEQELWKGWDETHAKVLELFEEFQFHTGLERIFAFVSSINRYAEQRAPWKLAKSEDPLDKQRLDTTLFAMSEAVRLAVGLLEPVMPETTEKVYALLGQTPDSNWKARLVRNEKLAGSTVGAKTILFPKPPVEA